MKINRIVYALVGSLLCFSLFGFSCAIKSLKNSALPGRVYKVRQGDALSLIANRYGIPLREVMEVNGIEKPTELQPGQLIFLPQIVEKNSSQSSSRATKRKQASKKTYSKKRRYTGKRIDLILPVNRGVIFRRFDENPETLFEGIAIGAPLKTPVRAAALGEVIYVANRVNRFGRMVILKHRDGFVSIYAHLNETKVKKGQKIKSGETVGLLGKSGGVESPMLFFQVRKDRLPVDPEYYIK